MFENNNNNNNNVEIEKEHNANQYPLGNLPILVLDVNFSSNKF